ncbi:hypothetical protein [Vacuolonema iberomarrocanum]|uniref:hypothetical protein n=1 Tax=Vacuolonema iberomarrocanum TaxID=3454632 RepID=UPI0019F83E1C|nr:hypothetical protein [filamentous cyanobacterium LEGE 07170]
MSKEALDKFLKEQFLPAGETQDRLKATESFEAFVDLMVRLGHEENYSFTAEEVRALVLDEINQQKATMDARSQALLDQEMATNWKEGEFVETGILNLRGDDVLPAYP